jgi:hypothetical protein
MLHASFDDADGVSMPDPPPTRHVRRVMPDPRPSLTERPVPPRIEIGMGPLRKERPMAKLRAVMMAAILASGTAGAAIAQTTDNNAPATTPAPAAPAATAPAPAPDAGVATTDHRDGGNWGWIGLVGLIGLAGLAGRRGHTRVTSYDIAPDAATRTSYDTTTRRAAE